MHHRTIVVVLLAGVLGLGLTCLSRALAHKQWRHAAAAGALLILAGLASLLAMWSVSK